MTLRTYFSLFSCSIQNFLFKKMHLKKSLAKCRPFSSGCCVLSFLITHYCDDIMGAMASQITSLTIVYSAVHSDADQRKHQSSLSLAFLRGIHRGPVNSGHRVPRTNGQLRGKCFHLMTSSWTQCKGYIICQHQGLNELRNTPYRITKSFIN